MGRIRNFNGTKKNPHINPARMTKVSKSSEILVANQKEKYQVTNWSVLPLKTRNQIKGEKVK
jgi:hypothetical protein